MKSCSILGEQLITICFMNQGVEMVAHDLENGYQYRQKRKRKKNYKKEKQLLRFFGDKNLHLYFKIMWFFKKRKYIEVNDSPSVWLMNIIYSV